MNFSWERELSGFSDGKIDQTTEKYYKDLQNQAVHLIAKINAENFSESISKLHGIDEKCQLLFFYIGHMEEEWFRDSSEMITCIEADYLKSYLEKLPAQQAYEKGALLYTVS
ncbi:hypothetical protein IW492_07845 [Enterococcus sp. BWB1-3]|uniref:DUF7006 family protein n=1 Tax=unclassified Enterococcus TaxID=2608891 RepID=UPI0019215FEE|nr:MULTISPECIES: hypothetical protein [unclassified Enterococcus]MBL1229145.1 hypothetical protein [Enterococcus sp. BWB1-3]MCB5952525.1 hypothetical protein [Enterococcus sp. BWT-B8]